mgnify:CR=1 FL=1
MKAVPESVNARVHQVVDDLKRYHPLRVILFGSAARGDADAFSDLDFVVLKATEQPLLERLKEVALLCQAPGAIDFFVYTPEEWQRMQEAESPFAERVMQEGRVVYEAKP